MIKIVAIDDSKAYLESLKLVFQPYNSLYDLAYCFSNFSDAYNVEFMLGKLSTIRPDVVLMDFSFSLTGQASDYGIDLVRAILAKYPKQKIIMLVGDEDDSDEERWAKIRRSFEAGAHAYLGKRDIAAWKDAITEVVNGENYIDQGAIKAILSGLRNNDLPAFELSDRQKEVLIHLAADKSLQEVADSIKSDCGKAITVHTVNFHLRNIRARLNCNTLHGVVAKAIKEKIIS